MDIGLSGGGGWVDVRLSEDLNWMVKCIKLTSNVQLFDCKPFLFCSTLSRDWSETLRVKMFILFLWILWNKDGKLFLNFNSYYFCLMSFDLEKFCKKGTCDFEKGGQH